MEVFLQLHSTRAISSAVAPRSAHRASITSNTEAACMHARRLPAADATLPRSQRPSGSCGELLPAQHPACSPDAHFNNVIFDGGRVAQMCCLCHQFLLSLHLLLHTSQHRAAISRTSQSLPDALLLRRAPSLHSAAAAAGAVPQQQRPQSAHAAKYACRIRISPCVTARAAVTCSFIAASSAPDACNW
jgi:hypothetical protein